jgi:hypothetical protein
MTGDPWSAATFDGNRRIQHVEFVTLSFREKLQALERMSEVAAKLGAGAAVTRSSAPPSDPSEMPDAQADTPRS